MRPWTIRAALKSMFAAVTAQPASLLAIAVLPGIWMVPATLIYDSLVPGATPVFGPGRPRTAILASVALSAWGCVWFAGQLSAAISTLAGARVRWRPFVTSVKKAPALFATGMVTLVPFEIAGLLPASTDAMLATAVEVVSALLVIFLLARTVLWAPLLVDTRLKFWTALRVSWTETREHWLRVVGFGCVLACLAFPILVMEAIAASTSYHFLSATLGAFFALAMAQLYAFTDAAGVSANVASYHASDKLLSALATAPSSSRS